MIFNSFITQVGMIILSVGILLLYIRPDFAEIGIIQNDIAEYKIERDKVNSTNERLEFLVSKVTSISASDESALYTFMPDQIDEVDVSRDIFIMAEASRVYLEAVTYEGVKKSLAADTSNSETKPVPHSFSVSVSGNYDDVKSFLANLEQNNYPLEVYSLEMSSTETGLVKAQMNVVTYSHK